MNTGWNALIFGMEHSLIDKEIQLCSNKFPGVTNGHTLREHSDKCDNILA